MQHTHYTQHTEVKHGSSLDGLKNKASRALDKTKIKADEAYMKMKQKLQPKDKIKEETVTATEGPYGTTYEKQKIYKEGKLFTFVIDNIV